jgi:hypothetical protein
VRRNIEKNTYFFPVSFSQHKESRNVWSRRGEKIEYGKARERREGKKGDKNSGKRLQ